MTSPPGHPRGPAQHEVPGTGDILEIDPRIVSHHTQDRVQDYHQQQRSPGPEDRFEIDPRVEIPRQATSESLYPDQPSYEPKQICLCRGMKDDRPTVHCSNGEICLTKEFHLDCVGLQTYPHHNDTWICPECGEYASDAAGNDPTNSITSTRRKRNGKEIDALKKVRRELKNEGITGFRVFEEAERRLLQHGVQRSQGAIRGQWYRTPM